MLGLGASLLLQSKGPLLRLPKFWLAQSRHVKLISDGHMICRTALGRTATTQPLAAGDDGMLLASRVQLLQGPLYDGGLFGTAAKAVYTSMLEAPA